MSTNAFPEAEATRDQLVAANRWLSFSQEAASILGSEGIEKGLDHILTDAAGLFRADCTAVIGDDNEWSFVASGVPADEAQRTMMHVALVAAGRSTPLHIHSLGSEPGQAIAVPLARRERAALRLVRVATRRGLRRRRARCPRASRPHDRALFGARGASDGGSVAARGDSSGAAVPRRRQAPRLLAPREKRGRPCSRGRARARPLGRRAKAAAPRRPHPRRRDDDAPSRHRRRGSASH